MWCGPLGARLCSLYLNPVLQPIAYWQAVSLYHSSLWLTTLLANPCRGNTLKDEYNISIFKKFEHKRNTDVHNKPHTNSSLLTSYCRITERWQESVEGTAGHVVQSLAWNWISFRRSRKTQGMSGIHLGMRPTLQQIST